MKFEQAAQAPKMSPEQRQEIPQVPEYIEKTSEHVKENHLKLKEAYDAIPTKTNPGAGLRLDEIAAMREENYQMPETQKASLMQKAEQTLQTEYGVFKPSAEAYAVGLDMNNVDVKAYVKELVNEDSLQYNILRRKVFFELASGAKTEEAATLRPEDVHLEGEPEIEKAA